MTANRRFKSSFGYNESHYSYLQALILANKIIRIATRQSPLALWQANYVAARLRAFFPDLEIELIRMVTRGDKMLDAPLAKIGGKGLFVKELEQGLLNGSADIAVHSMKDVPVEFPEGLHLKTIMDREDATDAFVSNRFKRIDDLPSHARIGTSSLRRQSQIKALFPNAEILPLRGNVNTRLEKLDNQHFDAIILASAGLKRLGMADRITHTLDTTYSLPAIGQGAIGIECRIDDDEVNERLALLHDNDTALCINAERAMNACLNGGCQVPIAGYAIKQDHRLYMRGLVGTADGSLIYRAEHWGDLNNPHSLGQTVAEDLLSQGAKQILDDLLK